MKKTATQKDSQQCKPIEWSKAKKALEKLEKTGNFNGMLLLAIGFYTGLRIGDMSKKQAKQGSCQLLRHCA